MGLGVANPISRLLANQAICFVLALFCCFAGGSSASAREKVTISAKARAVIVANLSFFKVDDMVFGKIIPGSTAGTVVLSPAGTRTATGGTRLASGTIPVPAKFAGKGSLNQQVTIAISANSITLNRVGGGATMTVDTFVIGSTPTAQLSTTPLAFRIAAPTGIFQFPLGATLRVKANQLPGIYSGSFNITLQYQ